jgi:hypothetical protein
LFDEFIITGRALPCRLLLALAFWQEWPDRS